MAEIRTDFPVSKPKRKILIVEDEFVNRHILTAYLEDEYDVICAENGAEARETILGYGDRLSLVLLDLILPDVHGLDILRWIKEDPRFSGIPVIVMTADSGAEVECLNIGAIDFITKPYPMPAVVQARVRRTIELYEDRLLIRETERDALTGLYTREYFFRYAGQYDDYHPGTETDAVVIDVNHFQMINERFGRAYADGVLKRMAAAVLEITERTGGIGCRRGADTFLMYGPHEDDYAPYLEKIVSAACGGDAGRVRVRMGVCPGCDRSIEMEHRFDRAKIAADTLRNSYTAFIALYDGALHEKEMYNERLIDDFDEAVAKGQFSVWFQPKYDIRPETPVICGAEALVRWIHPTLGFVSPGGFIPLLENNGLIRKLDDYIWRRTASFISEWRKRFENVVPISVNVSRVDMSDPDLPETMKAIADENGLPCEAIHLEITESAYTENAERIIETVKRLREIGFVIEMDDFGSGYSSINAVSTLPIDALKLDMALVRNGLKENGNARMLKAVIDMSASLSVPMIAEGVETEQQMLALREMGCDMVQGYYFARPMPAAEFGEYLAARLTPKG